MANKFTNRYKSFCASLDSLAEAKVRDPQDSFVLSATGSPRETLRAAASVNLITDDVWMEMLDKRNELTHDYDGSIAKACFETIVNRYIPLFEQFKDIVKHHHDY